MQAVSLGRKPVTSIVLGTPSIVGIGYINDKLMALGDIELRNFEEIIITPYDYCYIGGVENGHIKKPLCYKGIKTNFLVMAPGVTYTIVKLPYDSPLTQYRVTFNL